MLIQFLKRLRFVLTANSRSEVDEELRFHLDRQTEANMEMGMSTQEARRQAMLAFGGVERTREECHEQRPGFWVAGFSQDLRYSLRGFRRNPTFTLTAIVTLMLGIGATTAVFSVVDRILFRSLPYKDADRLVSVGLIAPIEAQEFMLGGSYYQWRDNQQPFEALTSETGVEPCDLTEASPVRLNCAGVESSFLPTLGVTPFIGRNFTAEEDTPNGPKVALISYSLWRSRFNRDPLVVDKVIQIDGRAIQIVGVLPEDFEMPRLQPADLVLPQALDEAAQRKADPGRPMWAFARLKPGVTIEQAKSELEPLFNYSLRLAPAPFRKEVHLQVRSLRDREVHDVRLVAWILLGLVITVLFIACTNVTGLLLARGASRERELGVRSALGASRMRLIRQALTESVVLSLTGGVAGFAFAELLLHLFIRIAPDGIPFLEKAQIDARILIVASLASLACGVVFGVVPALRRPRAQALVGRSAGIAKRARIRQGLVVAQLAASMVLLAGSALLLRSFANLQHQSLGMHTGSIVTASISLGPKAYPTLERQMAFFQTLERNLRYGPGITALAVSDTLPPGGYHHDQIYASLHIQGRPPLANGTGGLIAWRWVTPEYFRALDIPIVQGRGFSEEELNSPERFVILSKQLAERMFPNGDAIGQRIKVAKGAQEDPEYTVTGVAADVKNGGLASGDEPEYYKLRRNTPQDWNSASNLIVKTSLPAATVEAWVRSRIAAIDPTVPVEIETLSERVSKMADQPRFETYLLSFFALTGLLLALIGLYGVTAFLVVQRTQEIGVRMALGATRRDILQLFLSSGLRLILPGAIVGLLCSLALSRVLASLLFQVSPYDPLTFAAATCLLLFAALLAILIPATSATGVNPTEALRRE